jgi:hypothetical protein
MAFAEADHRDYWALGIRVCIEPSCIDYLLTYGVPAARVSISSDRKYEQLARFEGITHIENRDRVSALIRGIPDCNRRIEPRVIEFAERLDRYWDHVAEAVLNPPVEHCARSRGFIEEWLKRARTRLAQPAAT